MSAWWRWWKDDWSHDPLFHGYWLVVDDCPGALKLGPVVSAWLLAAVPSAISTGAAARTAPAATRRIQVVVAAVVFIVFPCLH